MSVRRRIPLLPVLVIAGTLSGPVMAKLDKSDLDAAAGRFQEKKFAEAASLYDRLLSQLGPGEEHLRETLVFNRGCAQLGAQDVAGAERSFLEVDQTATDTRLRSAARYNLGRMACTQAEALTEKDRPKAIEVYRRAERFFRNALGDQPGSPDAARNIELVQRRIAKLLEEQQQEQQQQHQPQQQDQNKQEQGKQDQQPPQPGHDQQKQDQKEQPQDQQGSNQSQQGEDQQQQEPKPDQKPGENQQKQETKGQQGQDQGAEERPAPQPAAKPQDHREFDLTAAQILDKEKKQRERMRQLMQLMRSRAAPVEKDW